MNKIQSQTTPLARTPKNTTGLAPQVDWPIRGPITSPFGERRHPVTGKRKMHPGIDIDLRTGDPVKTMAPGKVVSTRNDRYGGKTVVVDHGGGVRSTYMHLSSFAVKPGDTVSRGQKLGAGGNTGRSTGSHLHFEIAVNGERVDPREVLSGRKSLPLGEPILAMASDHLTLSQ